MRAQDITSTPRTANYLNKTIAVAGFCAFVGAGYVAWPALAHLVQKLF